IRNTILTRLASLDDAELIEALGMPEDSYEEATATTDPPKAHSHLQVEAALCIWENWIDRKMRTPTNERDTAFHNYWEHCGTVTIRHLSIDLADYCLAVYDALPDEEKYGRPYDWEIIPAILETIDWAIGPYVRLPAAEATAIVTRRLNATSG